MCWHSPDKIRESQKKSGTVRIKNLSIISPDYRITREHGTFLLRKGVWLTAVYHPSALLRDESKWAETEADFRAVREKWMSLEIK